MGDPPGQARSRGASLVWEDAGSRLERSVSGERSPRVVWGLVAGGFGSLSPSKMEFLKRLSETSTRCFR